MKIVYHISDNDGRASAAIIYREFGVMQMMTKNDFIGLAYTKPFDIPEIIQMYRKHGTLLTLLLTWKHLLLSRQSSMLVTR